MTKVLLDTDIGTDVDDAVCLAYLLSHPDCELLGITTVTGEAVKRASLASVLCKAAGREIRILVATICEICCSPDQSSEAAFPVRV